MANVSVTHTFSNSTTADATQVNTNFTDIINGTSDGTKDFSISALTCAGTATLNGHVILGSASNDDLTVNASLASSIPIKTTYSYDIGAATLGLRSVYLGSSDSAARSTRLIGATVASSWTLTLPTAVGTIGQFLVDGGGNGTSAWRYPEKTTSKTTTYTGTGDETVILCDASGGAFTVTLPAAASFTGKHYYLKKTDTSYNAVTIDGNASETIDGATTTTINTQYESIKIVSDGSNWHILSRDYPKIWASVTVTGSWTANTNYTAFQMRVGDSLRIRARVSCTGLPTAATLTITIPNSLTIDTAKCVGGGEQADHTYGVANCYDNGTRLYTPSGVYYNSTTSVALRYDVGDNSSADVSNSAPFAFNSNDAVYCDFLVPISGWKG